MLATFKDTMGTPVGINVDQVTYVTDYLGNTMVNFGAGQYVIVGAPIAAVVKALDDAAAGRG